VVEFDHVNLIVKLFQSAERFEHSLGLYPVFDYAGGSRGLRVFCFAFAMSVGEINNFSFLSAAFDS